MVFEVLPYGSEYNDENLSGCDEVQFDRYVTTFRKTILPLSLIFKTHPYQFTSHHLPKVGNSKICFHSVSYFSRDSKIFSFKISLFSCVDFISIFCDLCVSCKIF